MSNRIAGLSAPIPARIPSRAGGAVLAAITVLVGGWVHPLQESTSALEMYDLTPGSGHEVKLPRVLEEISGLATTADGRLFGHDDERAIVYEVNPTDGSIVKAFTVGSLGVRGDFEGIAIAGDRFFLITSAGELLEFREGLGGAAVGYQVSATGLGNLCEVEGLAFDPTENALLVPCKEARARDIRNHLVVYCVPLETMKPYLVPRVFLPFEELERQGLDDEFHPSAIEVHPLTHTLLLTSGQDEIVLELDKQGRLLTGRKLKKKEHPQPEGIAVLPDGSLILADEGQGKRGRLTRYEALRSGGSESP